MSPKVRSTPTCSFLESHDLLQSNKRTDEYSSHSGNALRLLHRTVSAIRAVVPTTFIVAIKMNAADYINSEKDDHETKDQDRVLDHVRTIASWGMVDFIEVSGGDYEKPGTSPTRARLGKIFSLVITSQDFSSTASPRQALFSRFSREVVNTLHSCQETTGPLPPLVLLTGGLKTPEILYTALSSNHAHLLGIGRGSVLCPDLPTLLKGLVGPAGTTCPDAAWSVAFRPEHDLWLQKYLPSIPLVGASINMMWHTIMMRRLASLPSSVVEGKICLEPDYGVGTTGALFRFLVWIDDVSLLLGGLFAVGVAVVLYDTFA